MNKNCVQCKAVFEIMQDDLAFYKKMSPVLADKTYPIPTPTHCPDCRQQRRLAFRNERHLYNRKCDFSGKQIVSIHPSDAPYKVYAQDVWWSDQWDPLEYGRDFDFKRSFFEQFNELMRAVPRLSLINKNCENSDYSLFSSDLKNCYLIFSALKSEDCYYGHQCNWSRNCVDISFCYESELCYEALDSKNCYACAYVQNCDGCTNCRFCYGCRGCSDCFLCTNLVNKKYCIQNVQYTKEEYEEKMRAFDLRFVENIKKAQQLFTQMKAKCVHRFAHLFNCENCTGDYLRDCKNVRYSFDLPKSEDAKYIWTGIGLKDCMDCCYTGRQAELCYESLSAFPAYRSSFTIYCWESSQVFYSDYCFNSQNLFGCAGMQRKEYCIFNKQYTKEEYEALVPRIIAHMEKTGEWGEFFPSSLSPFAYNETVAQEYYPLTKIQVKSHSFKWRMDDESNSYQGPIVEVPDDIDTVSDDITKQILRCEVTGKLYKIIPQELAFYRQMGLPIPRRCPDQRHKDRLALRNPRKLWKRVCANCHATIETTYASECSEKIYCEKCYLKAVY